MWIQMFMLKKQTGFLKGKSNYIKLDYDKQYSFKQGNQKNKMEQI